MGERPIAFCRAKSWLALANDLVEVMDNSLSSVLSLALLSADVVLPNTLLPVALPLSDLFAVSNTLEFTTLPWLQAQLVHSHNPGD